MQPSHDTQREISLRNLAGEFIVVFIISLAKSHHMPYVNAMSLNALLNMKSKFKIYCSSKEMFRMPQEHLAEPTMYQKLQLEDTLDS